MKKLLERHLKVTNGLKSAPSVDRTWAWELIFSESDQNLYTNPFFGVSIVFTLQRYIIKRLK